MQLEAEKNQEAAIATGLSFKPALGKKETASF